MPPQGGEAAATAPAAKEAAAATEGGSPLTFFFLGSTWSYRGALPLEMAAKKEANSQLWVVPPKNRVSDQYIVLEASPGPLD
jgi:hypothetical protein